MWTPWGTADFIEHIAPGVDVVATPSHGGVRVLESLARKNFSKIALSQAFVQCENGYYWFEEDAAWAIVRCEMPTLKKLGRMGDARNTVMTYYPEYYLEKFPNT